MNKKTKALTTEQYKEIIETMREGFSGCRPNERIATILVLEGNLGLRISDILKLRLCDIVRDGDRFRLDITEQKTGKLRSFTVPRVIRQYIENYCLRNGIRRTAHLAAQRIDFVYKMPLCRSADGRIAGHIGNGVKRKGEKHGGKPHPRGGKRRLHTRVSCAYYCNVSLFLHSCFLVGRGLAPISLSLANRKILHCGNFPLSFSSEAKNLREIASVQG